MRIETLAQDGCRTHLIVAERTREAVLVDPLLPTVDADLAVLRERGLTLRWVVDTHTHADHLSAGSLLLKKSDAGYLMHDSTRVTTVTRRVGDGEELGLGETTLRFLHVPGHTRDSLAVALPGVLLTGDFLFLGVDGAGRLDLPGGDADAHYASLRKLDEYRGGTELRPAHDYQGRSVSTLKAERAANPVLSPRTRDEYLKFWSQRRPGPADWMGAVVAANAAGTIDPSAVSIPKDGYACTTCSTGPATPTVPEISPADLAVRLARERLTVIDVREPEEYHGELGRIKGSRSIPVGQLPSRLAEVPEGPVVTVCRSGQRSARAAAELLRSGRTQVRSMTGGMLAWNAASLPVERA